MREVRKSDRKHGTSAGPPCRSASLWQGDGGNGFGGAVITPYFDSLLVKVTTWGQTAQESIKRMDRAIREFHVGNLYINRKCTGAMVGAHPFGGFNMSGTDSKSGGPDYLYLFTQAKVVGEKIS